MRFYIVLFYFLFIHFSCYQQGTNSTESIIYDIVHELSLDSYQGRQTGEVGGEKAALYLENYLQMIFENDKNVNIYSQEFEFHVTKNPHVTDNKGVKKIAQNIMCFVDNDREETIVIGAHYDHLGFGEFGSLYSGDSLLIHNGADDNASGVAMGIALLESLYDSSPFYNYLFIAFDGEEMGLYGSSFFCKNPTINLSKVRFMINFDMVGRLNKTKDLAINGVGTSSVWPSLIEDVNKSYNFQLKLSKSGIGPSDHSSFYLQNIPAIHLFTGQHADYHKPTDDIEKLNFLGMKDIVSFVEDVVVSSFNINVFDFQETVNNSTVTPKFSVTLGVMPDYLFSGKGMRIDGVSKNKTAFKYGILKGDIVIRMGAIDVVDMVTYMEGLSQFNEGDSTFVTVIRSGKKHDIKVVF